MVINISKAVPESEYSEAFIQGMVNRMGFSFHKYGPVADAYPKKVDAVASLLKRLAKYIGTKKLVGLLEVLQGLGVDEGDGNTEWLMDVANFAMIEYMLPRKKNAHFKATNSDESPGRVMGKKLTAAANTDEKQTRHDALNTYRGREGD